MSIVQTASLCERERESACARFLSDIARAGERERESARARQRARAREREKEKSESVSESVSEREFIRTVTAKESLVCSNVF